MVTLDEQIQIDNENICRHLKKSKSSGMRGLESQDILNVLRNLAELIMQKVAPIGKIPNPRKYTDKELAKKWIKTQAKFKWLWKFHILTTISSGHVTQDENASERLMLKYYEYLLKIKKFMSDTYNMDLLQNLSDFPLHQDPGLQEYYERIASRIETPAQNTPIKRYSSRLYVQKIKPFFVGEETYYEVTYTIAYDNVSKFDRVTAFTKHNILENYSVRFSVREDHIDVFGRKIPIKIIEGWDVAIRPCELEHISNIFGMSGSFGADTYEYRNLMQYLKTTNSTLVDLIDLPDQEYRMVKISCLRKESEFHIFEFLDRARKFASVKREPGSNVVRYLLFTMRNSIIKDQYSSKACCEMPRFHLAWGCLPFDQMPFASSLIGHNPSIMDLYQCLDSQGREHELFARYLNLKALQNDVLFTPAAEIDWMGDLDKLANDFNEKVYYKHAGRKIFRDGDMFYVKGKVVDTANILLELKNCSSSGIQGYANFASQWIQNAPYDINDEKKKEALKTMFVNSRVTVIKGSAGTGKSTLMSHISRMFKNRSKLYLANTHTAVENLRRRIGGGKMNFMTVAAYIKDEDRQWECDVLFIDECSTITNENMLEILHRSTFQALVLAGDERQIESIGFGNWFGLLERCLPSDSIIELDHPYRSADTDLIELWNKVRRAENDEAQTRLSSYNYAAPLGPDIFKHSENEDEIILCLNYDGLYGVNNLNRMLQANNNGDSVEWGINTYKIGDPVLFNEAKRFSKFIYNNTKGWIRNIVPGEDKTYFEIEIDLPLTGIEITNSDIALKDCNVQGHSLVGFYVMKPPSTDGDDEPINALMPFQIAYAITVHKAQGLEFDSVKIVVTDEVGERVTHNIFYTAITRAKKDLKVYWSPETQKLIMDRFRLVNHETDFYLMRKILKVNL